MTDRFLKRRIQSALKSLRASGHLTGARTRRVVVRLDPGLIRAAKERSGIKSDAALLEAALALMAEPDDFWPWLSRQRGTLDKDFELPR